MNLLKKKKLAARTLGVGLERVKFNEERLDEIKEAITSQDIRDLVAGKAIIIKEKSGRKKLKGRKKRGMGKIKKKIRRRKENYMNIARKLRKYLKALKKQGKIDKDRYKKLRKQIKAKMFRSKSHFEEQI